MGKVGGFLEQERTDPGYRPVEERVKDYKAVEKLFDESDVINQAARCMSCGTPFCHAGGCPLGNIIPELNHLAYEGNWKEATQTLLATASFPEFTGRLCPALCETACVLDGLKDTAVSIRQIELSIIEKAFEEGHIRPAPPVERREQKVAVVGSGPAGLAVADYLNRAGYPVVVYDDADKPGGLLRYGIPDFKMEKWVIDRRIDLMMREGIELELGVSVGDDVSLNFLSRKYAAIALCCGSQTPRDLPVPGRDLKGIHFAMAFLTRQNKIVAGEPYDDSPYLDAKGKSVVVIGGGDTGSDCIGTSVRQGAKKIYQLEILPEPPSSRPDTTPWPMWPNLLRTSSSHKEGGERRWSAATKAFIEKDGAVAGLKGVEVVWQKAPDGRWQMEERAGTELELKTELVLLAMGFVGPRKSRLLDDLQVEFNPNGAVKTDENHMTSKKGIFSAGDMAIGQSLIVRALADGRKTAQGIIRYLEKEPRTTLVS
jgi:glutamate synthase (NADPH/NADH) small chain